METKKFKHIINNGNINLYRGCSHGCIYCDTRSTCYKVENYDEITVKENALEQLNAEMKTMRKKITLHTGSMCDPYMPIEAELKHTRGLLELCLKHGFGIRLITKSSLILRDIDLLSEISKRTFALAEITLTTWNEDLCKKLEPNVATTQERLHAIKTLEEAGVKTCVWLCPLLPFINDTKENLVNLLNAIHAAGCRYIISFGFGVTLREGSREYFYKQLDKLFPGMKQQYQKEFGYAYMCNSPHHKELWALFKEKCKELNINYNTKEIFALGKNLTFSSQVSIFD